MSVYLGWVVDESDTERTFKYPFNKYDATAAPGAGDDTGDGFEEGSLWVDVTGNKAYTCVDNSSGAAVWVEHGGSGGSYQPLDATLTAFAALTIAANSLTIGTGTDAFSQTTFGANTFPARASTGNLVAKTITDFALTILDDADAATVRATIGAGTGSGTVTGSGTASSIPRWSGSTALGDSTVTDDGSTYVSISKRLFLATSSSYSGGSNQNDYSLGNCTSLIFNSSADIDLTGIVAPSSPAAFGQMVVVVNESASYKITLKHQSTSSTAANRLACPVLVDFVLNQGQAVGLFYSGSRWRVIAPLSFAGYTGTGNVVLASAIAYFGAQAYNSANISHTTSGSWQSVTLNSERFDTSTFHSTSSNTQRMTVPSGMAGKYEIKARIIFDANATGSRGIAIDKNGMFGVGTNLAFDIRAAAPGGGDTTACQTTCVADLAVGDYVEMSGYQNSGAALNMLALFTAPELTFTYLGA